MTTFFLFFFSSFSVDGNPFAGGFGGRDPSFLFTDFTSFFTDAFGGRGTNGHVHKGDDMVVSESNIKTEKLR